MIYRRSIRIAAIVAIVFMFASVSADEGMWPLYDLDKLSFKDLAKRGLTLTPEQIYNPEGTGIASAVVQVGATGSFVSPQGLILTNHHVAFDAIQQQSTVEQNYLRDGFYAATLAEEIPAIGYKISVTQSIEDVTKIVLADVKEGISDFERYRVIDLAIKKLVKQCESSDDIKCRVAKMFGGKQYMLYKSLELRDIRIVYVPPYAIGNYGGDIDNWMWPRHTGDFSFLRAYVGPDGQAAEYAKENVPYQSPVYLPVSAAGIREGDFCMTLGFPGYTERYASSYDIENQLTFEYPRSIKVMEDNLQIMSEAGRRDSAIALRLASDDAGINNTLKNSYGTLEGFTKADILNKKRNDERQLAEFLKTKPELERRYGHVLPELDSLYQTKRANDEKDFVLSRLNWSAEYLAVASRLYKWSIERQKPDLERERGYQERDTTSTREWLEDMQINLVPQVDREKMEYALRKALALPEGQRIAAIDKAFAGMSDGALEKYLDDAFARTKLGEVATRLELLKADQSTLEKLDDPFFQLAIALRPEMDERLRQNKEFSGALTRLSPQLIQAYAEWKNGSMYPDANGTMRLSYGEVKGYTPRDGERHFYLTSLSGVLAKETGVDPFIVPEQLSQFGRAKKPSRYTDPVIKDVPVNFLTTNDITGGNSGSPVINGRGEMIGLAFDGNWEGVASDYLFIPDVTRTIAVDIRYVLFLLDEVYHLDGLLRELTVHKGGASSSLR